MRNGCDVFSGTSLRSVSQSAFAKAGAFAGSSSVFTSFVISFIIYSSIKRTESAQDKYSLDPPITRMVETCFSRQSSRTRSVNGTIGSFFTIFRIFRSRIIKLVALLSSSMSSSFAPPQTASIMFDACDTLPLACVVEKLLTSALFGKCRKNGDKSRL